MSTLRVAGLLALPLLLAACDAIYERPGLEAPARDFGAPYEVLLERDFQSEGIAPDLDDEGFLMLQLVYEGGCGEHTFLPEYELVGARTAEVWLRHVAPDPCAQSKSVSASVVVELQPTVQEQERVVLVSPSGNAFVLRDGVGG
ncbi:MAG: hypothetical protein R3362_05015 [Rhodothermales bacterium]|nr:hypothetical protein [Rhodothermales bacterium]